MNDPLWPCIGLVVVGLQIAVVLDIWSNTRATARAAKLIAQRLGEIDLDAIEMVLYLRAMHARAEGAEPDTVDALEEIGRARKERRKK